MGPKYNFIPDTVRIPTARLVNKVIDINFAYPSNKELQFNMFIDNFRHDLDNYKLADEFVDYEKCIDSDLVSTPT
jgi:hypothetical protein